MYKQVISQNIYLPANLGFLYLKYTYSLILYKLFFMLSFFYVFQIVKGFGLGDVDFDYLIHAFVEPAAVARRFRPRFFSAGLKARRFKYQASKEH